MCTSGSIRRRVLLFGATGTAGRATARALDAAGHEVVCVVRRDPRASRSSYRAASGALAGFPCRPLDIADPSALRCLFRDEDRFDAIVSCLASRTGVPQEAWAIDHQAHLNILAAAKIADVPQMVLLSAICVQKPRLAFQHAKLAFEQALRTSGLDWAIVRPTAFFKSLSGQVERVRRGKSFLLFGNGTLTACKPIGDDDLGRFIASCVVDTDKRHRVLPIGGPGEAITPREQGEYLFALTGRKPRYRQVPPGMLTRIATGLDRLGTVYPRARIKAELARIGHYYATESMLVFDPDAGRYDAAATPATGSETLFDYYDRLVSGTASAERGEHAIF